MTNAMHEAAKAHFLRRVAETPLRQIPAPHALIRGVFPERYYQSLLGALPRPDKYIRTLDANDYERECRALAGLAGERRNYWVGPDDHDAFLSGLALWITAPDVLDSLHKTYLAPVSEHFSASPPGAASVRLVRESGVGYIRPHLDKPFKVMTMVFFLADGLDDTCPGTELYADKPDNGNLLEILLRAPFEGNSVFIMPRTPNSWHGVSPTVLSHPRNTLHVYLIKKKVDD